MKVQALTNGYYCEQRIHRGDIFELKERKGFSKNERGEKVPYHFSVESQFSKRWMRKVDDAKPMPELEDDDLNLPGVKIKKPGKKRTLSDAGDSVI